MSFSNENLAMSCIRNCQDSIGKDATPEQISTELSLDGVIIDPKTVKELLIKDKEETDKAMKELNQIANEVL